jgi:hypothetical protein
LAQDITSVVFLSSFCYECAPLYIEGSELTMARAKGKKKQGGRPTGQPNNRTETNPVQPETKPSGRPTRQSTQRTMGQVDPSKTDPDAAPLSGDPGPGPSSPTDRTLLDPTVPPYVPRSTQKLSPTPSSLSRPRVIDVETVSSNSVRSDLTSPHRFEDVGGAT